MWSAHHTVNRRTLVLCDAFVCICSLRLFLVPRIHPQMKLLHKCLVQRCFFLPAAVVSSFIRFISLVCAGWPFGEERVSFVPCPISRVKQTNCFLPLLFVPFRTVFRNSAGSANSISSLHFGPRKCAETRARSYPGARSSAVEQQNTDKFDSLCFVAP